MKERICDSLVLALILIFYGGVILAVIGLCSAQQNLCWIGLMLSVAALVAISMGCVMGELRDIAGCNSLFRALSMGLRVVGEAMLCIFLYLVAGSITFFVRGLTDGVKFLKCKYE